MSSLGVGVHVCKSEPELETFDWQGSTQGRFYDDRAGFELYPELVKRGGRTEMDFVANLSVWHVA